MTPAEEKARLAAVQLALEHLISEGPQTRAQLFGETKSDTMKAFQRNSLKSLETSGVIYKAETGTPPVSRVHLKNRKKAEHLLQHPIELAQIVWPGSRLKQVIEDYVESAPIAVAHSEPIVLTLVDDIQGPIEPKLQVSGVETPPVIQAPDPVVPTVDKTTQQLLEQLLIIMDAACQRIIYTSEKVDKMELQINKMENQLNHLWESLK